MHFCFFFSFGFNTGANGSGAEFLHHETSKRTFHL